MKDPLSFEFNGTITSLLSGMKFRVELENGHTVLAHLSARFRKKWQRLVLGDKVKVEMSPYDKEKARIIYRL